MQPIVFIASLLALALPAASQVVITAQGYATSPGAAVVAPPASVPVLATPLGYLTTVRPGPGATAAAPGQQVGASSSGFPTRVTPTLPNIVPQVTAPVMMMANPAVVPAPAQESSGTAEQGGGKVGPAESEAAARFDFGMASLGEMEGETRSVAEVASAYRRPSQRQAARTYTNQDIDEMNQQTSVSIAGGGTSGLIVGMGAETGVTQAAPAAGAVSEPMRPEPERQMMAEDRMATERRDLAQAQPGRLPGIPQQGPEAEARPSPGTLEELPVSASPLPWMVLLGLAAAAAGVLGRR
jgi:hypothetical protein